MDFKELVTTLSPIIVAIVVGVWGLIQQIQKSRSDKPKTDAETTERFVEAAAKVIDQYQEILEEFRKEKTNDMTKYQQLQGEYQKLQKDFSGFKDEFEKMRESNENLKFEVASLREVIIRLARQMEEANLTPDIDIREITKQLRDNNEEQAPSEK